MNAMLKTACDGLKCYYKCADDCEKIVIEHACIAGAGGLIPFPVAGTVVITGVMWIMYGRIVKTLGIKVSENFGKVIGRFILSNLAANVALNVAIFASDLIKFVPGIGTLIGMVSAPLSCAAGIYVAGVVFLKSLEKLAAQGKDVSEENMKEELKNQLNNKEIMDEILKEGKESLKGMDFKSFKEQATAVYNESKDEAEKFCPQCKTTNALDAKFCSECGQKL